MINLSQIETEIREALKARDGLRANTLRGLKTRIVNEQVAKISVKGGLVPSRPALGTKADGKELSEEEIFSLVRSEIKKRQEAAAGFTSGGRKDLAEKELAEAEILKKYLPPQLSEAELDKIIQSVIEKNQFSAKDFGKAMGMLKQQVGQFAEGALLAKLLKEKLK